MKRWANCILAAVLICTLTACSSPHGSTANKATPKQAKAAFSAPDYWQTTATPGVYTLGTVYDLPNENLNHLSIQSGILFYDFEIPQMDSSQSRVVLFDMATGKERRQFTFENGARNLGQLADGGFYELDYATAKLTTYTANGTQQESAKVADEEQLASGTLSPDGNTVLYDESVTNSGLHLYNLKAKKDIAICGGLKYGYTLGTDASAFYVRDMTGKFWQLKQTGIATLINSRPAAQITLPYITESNEFGYMVQSTDTGKMLTFKADTEREVIATAAEGFLLAEWQGSLRLYNLNSGRFSNPIPVNGTFMQSAYAADGYFAVVTEKDGKNTTTLLLPSAMDLPNSFSSGGDSYEAFEDGYFEKYPVDSTTEQLLKSIYDKYMVRVILKSSRFEKDICGYACSPVKDSEIAAKVKSVDNFLSLLPRGMTGEIYGGAPIWVYLCTDPHTTDGGSHVSGFASLFCGHPFIAIDAAGKDIYFTETLAHEFSHLFDYRLDGEWLDGWEALSPKDGYCMRMSNLPGRYTPYSNDNSEVFFFDIYSTTFPTEDRAVIFEKMYYEYASGETVPDLHRKHIEEKTDYYAKMLRANFPSCAQAESLFWEKNK